MNKPLPRLVIRLQAESTKARRIPNSGRLGMPTNGKEAQGESSDAPRAIDATMAVFLDLENIALGAKTAQFPPFNSSLSSSDCCCGGHIVVKKADCDFDRYKEFKKDLHEAAIRADRNSSRPAVGQEFRRHSDGHRALDLSIRSSIWIPLRFVAVIPSSAAGEQTARYQKQVIGVGVDKLEFHRISNCDQFLYYDDLVREGTQTSKGAPKPKARLQAERRNG